MVDETESADITTALEIKPSGTGAKRSITISGELPNLHDDPAKVRQLLDLLELPAGTEVRLVTTAASVIVR